jgi:hypothetical protein
MCLYAAKTISVFFSSEMQWQYKAEHYAYTQVMVAGASDGSRSKEKAVLKDASYK